jgi:hypothetical protein
MFVAKNEEMVTVAKTRAFMHPTPVFGMGDVWQRNCNEEMVTVAKTRAFMYPTPVFGMGDVRQRN